MSNNHSPINFSGQVAIVTGAGQGLGKAYALDLAKRGAKVVVNDLGATLDGEGNSMSAAETVVKEIEAAGGTAIANTGSVTDAEAMNDMVNSAKQKWGRIDVLVCNAGILRDKSFAKMDLDNYKAVVDVHLFGTATCIKAVWPAMLEQQYGRIVVTTSVAGLYGNFGQANYSSAKMGMIGLMKTLNAEGVRKGIRLNAISPAATTRMTEGLHADHSAERADAMSANNVAPGVVYLCSDEAPIGTILNAGGGGYCTTTLYDSYGIDHALNCSAEDIRDRWQEIDDQSNITAYKDIIELSEASAARMPK